MSLTEINNRFYGLIEECSNGTTIPPIKALRMWKQDIEMVSNGDGTCSFKPVCFGLKDAKDFVEVVMEIGAMRERQRVGKERGILAEVQDKLAAARATVDTAYAELYNVQELVHKMRNS